MQLKNNTILVSGASGIVGYGILKSLRNCSYNLIGTTIYDESPANIFASIVERPPLTVDKEYIPWLISTIRKYNVSMLIPGIEADMKIWNLNRDVILSNSETILMINNPKLIEVCLDKWKFYQELEKNNMDCRIRTTLDIGKIDFCYPILLKPRCGFGSKGITIVQTKEQLVAYERQIGSNLMIQEIVGNEKEEYTISAFFDKESNLKAYIPMKRKLSKQGFTEIAEVVLVKDILPIIEQLADIFKPIGPTNFQFRKHKNKWKLLEINPRVSSSTSIRCAFGYNESQMCVDYFLNKKEIVQPKIKCGKAIRYTEDYIIYDGNYI